MRAWLSLSLLLAGCGVGTTDPTYIALTEARAQVMQVGVEAAGTAVLARREALRDGIATFLTPDGASVVTQDGMLRGTRGLGADMLASDIAASRALVLTMQGGTVERIHTFLDGENHAVPRRFGCIIEVQGPRQIAIGLQQLDTILLTENCTNPEQAFVNYYWVLPTASRVVQSRQWGGAFSGMLVMRDVAP